MEQTGYLRRLAINIGNCIIKAAIAGVRGFGMKKLINWFKNHANRYMVWGILLGLAGIMLDFVSV